MGAFWDAAKRKMRNAKPSNFEAGLREIDRREEARKPTDSRKAAIVNPVIDLRKKTVHAGAVPARIFGRTVEAVRLAKSATKGKGGTAQAAAIGAAGSAGFFGQSGAEAFKAAKDVNVPKPVKVAAAFAAGVVAVPVAAKYLPSTTAAAAPKVLDAVTPDGRRGRNPLAGGIPTADSSPRGAASKPRVEATNADSARKRTSAPSRKSSAPKRSRSRSGGSKRSNRRKRPRRRSRNRKATTRRHSRSGTTRRSSRGRRRGRDGRFVSDKKTRRKPQAKR